MPVSVVCAETTKKFFLKILFISLRENEQRREIEGEKMSGGGEAGRGAELDREADFLLMVGLDPGPPRS